MAYYEGEACVDSAAGCEPKKSVIGEKTGSIEKSIRVVRDLITCLSGRIDPILSPAAEKTECNEDPRPCGGSPLANWMVEADAELKSIARKIESIIRRVEV